MKKKQITQKEAKEKYGIVISKSQKLDRTKFFLLANGNVVDSLGDIRFQKPKCYGDYQSKSEDENYHDNCHHELFQRRDQKNKTWCRKCGEIVCLLCMEVDEVYKLTGMCQNIPL